MSAWEKDMEKEVAELKKEILILKQLEIHDARNIKELKELIVELNRRRMVEIDDQKEVLRVICKEGYNSNFGIPNEDFNREFWKIQVEKLDAKDGDSKPFEYDYNKDAWKKDGEDAKDDGEKSVVDKIKVEYEKGLKEGKWLEYPPRDETPSKCKFYRPNICGIPYSCESPSWYNCKIVDIGRKLANQNLKETPKDVFESMIDHTHDEEDKEYAEFIEKLKKKKEND